MAKANEVKTEEITKVELTPQKNEGKPGLPMKVEDSPIMLVQADPEEMLDVLRLTYGDTKPGIQELGQIRVPTGGSKFWEMDGEDPTEDLVGIVIDRRPVRAWWPTADPTGKPPSCASNDSEKGYGVRWEDDEEKPHDCFTCPYAQFKSAEKGEGQACKQMLAVFFLPLEYSLPKVLLLPPTSIKVANDRLSGITAKFNTSVKPPRARMFYDVLVAWRVVPDKNAAGQPYGRAVPNIVRDLAPVEAERVRPYAKAFRAMIEKKVEKNGEEASA